MLAGFGAMINAMDRGDGRTIDGDRGAIFPRSDSEDFSRGARFIPGAVTEARRAGMHVTFDTSCSSNCCWFWQLPDGSRNYHYDPLTGKYNLQIQSVLRLAGVATLLVLGSVIGVFLRHERKVAG